MNEEIKIKPSTYRWTMYAISTNDSRQFPGNVVMFVQATTFPVVINDVFVLPGVVGSMLSLNGNQNEIDLTLYKFSIPSGGKVFVMVKEDAGILAELRPVPNSTDSYIPDRREMGDNSRKKTNGPGHRQLSNSKRKGEIF